MHVHRSAPVRSFTVLPNGPLQDRRLTYTARGLLVDLLSRPDGWREDGRAMADSSPQGRGAVRRALKELAEAGYYRVVKVRRADGTIRSEAHVFDTPQRPEPPGVPHPVAGEPVAGRPDAPPVKNPDKEPTLPVPSFGDRPDGRETGPGHDVPAVPDERLSVAARTLLRVIGPEPRLRLGQAELAELAPLAAQWLEHGSTHGDLAHALLSGLPRAVYSPLAVLRYRLERKMPPARAPEPPAARYTECPTCRDLVPRQGGCRACAGLGARTVAVGGGAEATPGGAARARAALRAARAALPLGGGYAGPAAAVCGA
ncbi:helix-turn-helix domain-containing protein [Kitasatospora sp. NBC_00374]|uniref:hypothetical protein n=1 Tax=Kitasatospora sp. NBC_00374 TaxID=2975964 RepID=UPI0030DFA17E